MHRSLCVFTVTLLMWGTGARAGEPAMAYTPEQVIAKAIAYHDPAGVWETGRVQLVVRTTYSEKLAKEAGSKQAMVTIDLSPAHEEFGYDKRVGDDRIVITMQRGQTSVEVNGSTDVSEEDRERLRLRDAATYRDYCEYLYGMPMKLRDPGTILAPHADSGRFNGRKVWRLRVTYEPDVGEHTWYFFFDHDTFALVGYKFYLDESKNDGEYITLDGEIIDQATNLRLPKARAWYYNADDGYLATDDIIAIDTTGAKANRR